MKARWFFPVGVVAGVVASLYLGREPSEPLTSELLGQARARWEAAEIDDYVIELDLGGRQSGLHRVEVVDGQVVDMTTGGEAAPEHVWTYWSVEGMFQFLRTELQNAGSPQASFGVELPEAVRLRAGFDEANGLPRRFLRHVEGRPLDIDWTVTLFEPAS